MIRSILLMLSVLSVFTSLYSEDELFKSFTGQVVSSHVRLRISPNLDGVIVKELHRGDMMVIDGEENGFYRVLPLSDLKAYVFRTFILDGEVEGMNVNVRLFPELDSPIIAQLNTGDHVDGQISSSNNKWIEFTPPESVRFYVASDYIETVGDASYLASYEKKKSEATRLLNTFTEGCLEAIKKPFKEIKLETLYGLEAKLQENYGEFEEHIVKASKLKHQFANQYLEKKIAYLEERAIQADQLLSENRNSEGFPELSDASLMTYPKLSVWKEMEHSHFMRWYHEVGQGNEADFYVQEKKISIKLQGILEPYLRPVRNKPGDYLLIDAKDQKPLAYLYSTHVDLQKYLGNEVELFVTPRPNNNFAYPAYYVLEVK
ncbi:hypothetical protein N9Y92_01795 [Chlamydiales bacterium]|nr:hypothetical protein [Chlamydiales bacterium]